MFTVYFLVEKNRVVYRPIDLNLPTVEDVAGALSSLTNAKGEAYTVIDTEQVDVVLALETFSVLLSDPVAETDIAVLQRSLVTPFVDANGTSALFLAFE